MNRRAAIIIAVLALLAVAGSRAHHLRTVDTSTDPEEVCINHQCEAEQE